MEHFEQIRFAKVIRRAVRRIAASIAKLPECGGPRTLALYRILRITQQASADTVD